MKWTILMIVGSLFFSTVVTASPKSDVCENLGRFYTTYLQNRQKLKYPHPSLYRSVHGAFLSTLDPLCYKEDGSLQEGNDDQMSLVVLKTLSQCTKACDEGIAEIYSDQTKAVKKVIRYECQDTCVQAVEYLTEIIIKKP